MEHVTDALLALEKAVKRANGRRKKRLLSSEDVLRAKLPRDEKFLVVRDYSIDGSARRGRFFRHKRQGKTTAALIFREQGKVYVLMRAVRAPNKNGFTDLIWGGKWRKKAKPFEIEKNGPIWLPSPEDLAIYSDYLEERGLKRVA